MKFLKRLSELFWSTVTKEPETTVANANEWTRRLSEALSLDPYDEDWALMNADPERLEEFLDFVDRHVAVDAGEYEDLAELILLSAEELAAKEVSNTRALIVRVALFVQTYHLLFPRTLKDYAGPDAFEGEIETLVQHSLLDHYNQRPT
jgi:hypothetical protein